ncbi:MAG TPA: trypsin-like peptidase domain-containing protein [Longimicrobiales bacterium]|nr:trypsin-like peptidase domain-containing protein [Longimicrobiales bacterium]
MKTSRYSSSGRRPPSALPELTQPIESEAPVAPEPARPRGKRRQRARLAALCAIALVVGAASAIVVTRLTSGPQITQYDIDQAVLHTLANMPRGPTVEAVAFETIRPSVVSVRRLVTDPDSAESPEVPISQSLGTGVVIVDDGTILTNLHVVVGAERLGVIFADGTESTAEVVSVQPEQDLAVIRAHSIPDDLVPATLASTRDLRVGDRVVAVGFPFGIGPSLSSGVVSGLGREYQTPEGERVLSNLIQFDAAVNPGNSGGPLVNADGHVVGIVTAILNPTAQRVFIGIGFAVPIETAAAGAGMSPF